MFCMWHNNVTNQPISLKLVTLFTKLQYLDSKAHA